VARKRRLNDAVVVTVTGRYPVAESAAVAACKRRVVGDGKSPIEQIPVNKEENSCYGSFRARLESRMKFSILRKLFRYDMGM
jgi:hypothetical protein